MTVIESIKNCKGIEQCWVERNEECNKPVAFQTAGNVELMIITEQVPDKYLKDSGEPTEELKKELKEAKIGRGLTENSTPWGINNILNGKFIDDFDKEQFRNIYWTHFIKCPGNLRGKKYNKWKLMEDKCADHWIEQEIMEFRPEYLITFGARASQWILKKAEIDVNWQEWMWSKIVEPMIKYDKLVWPELQISDVKMKLLVLYHPSGLNTIGRIINNKIKDKINDNLTLIKNHLE